MIGRAVIACAAVGVAGVSAALGQTTLVQTDLLPTVNAPSGISGTTRLMNGPGFTEFVVELQGLEPQNYPVLIDGVEQTKVFVTFEGAGTGGDFVWRWPPKNQSTRPLTFSTDSVLVEVLDIDGATVLLSATTEPAIAIGRPIDQTGVFNTQRLRVIMTPPEGITTIRGTMKLNVKRQKATWKIVGRGLEPSTEYALVVNNLEVARDTTNTSGKSKIEFSTKPSGSQQLLEFDPTDSLVRFHVVDPMTGTWDPDDWALGADLPGNQLGMSLLPVGVEVIDDMNDLGATGTATLFQSSDVLELGIAVQSLEVGTYEVYVDGVLRDFMNVTVPVVPPPLGAPPPPPQGAVLFSSQPLPMNDVPLVFEPRGSLVEIVQDGEVFLFFEMPSFLLGR